VKSGRQGRLKKVTVASKSVLGSVE
jgi:hypothetical protein